MSESSVPTGPDLLSTLRAAGTVEAVGRFTLDSEKARDKLRQYQLADPHRYVLLLVEAMALAGAGKLEFAIDSDDVRLACDCRPFAYDRLTDLYGSLFVEIDPALDAASRDHVRGLQQLAYALNSAMALNPRFVRIESVDAERQGVRLELTDQPDRIERIVDAAPGTRIHVRDRFRPGLLVEFVRSLAGEIAEEKLLRRHCRWSRIAIAVDGDLISGPMEFDGEYWFAEDVEDEGRPLGRAALHLVAPGSAGASPATATLLCNGVWVETLALEHSIAGFAAIIDDNRLRRDVSQLHILRDAALERVTDALRAAESRLVARLAERWTAASDKATMPMWTTSTLLEWLRKRSGQRLDRLLGDPGFSAVANVPLWRALGGAQLTTRELIEHDPLHFSEQTFDFAPTNVPFVVDLSEADDRHVFTELFGRKAVDHGPALRIQQERDRFRNLFLSRPHPAELGEGYYLWPQPLEGVLTGGERYRGELGLRSLGHRDSWVRLVHAGCLLQEVTIEHPIPGLCVVVEANFTPGEHWDVAVPDERLAAVAIEIARGIERMLRNVADSEQVEPISYEIHELLRAYVRAAADPGFLDTFLDQFGFGEQAVRALRRGGLDVTGLVPDFAPLCDPAAAPTDVHPIAGVPLYPQARGRPLSLFDLVGWRRAGLRIAWLDHDIGPLPELDRGVLLLEVDDRTALRSLFRDDAFERYHDRLAVLRERAAFMARPPGSPEFSGDSLARVRLVAPGIQGELGLAEFVARADTILGPSVARFRVFHHQRPLKDIELAMPLPGLGGWVDGDQLQIASGFNELAQPQELRPILLRGLSELVRAELVRARTRADQLRRCEWWFLLRSFGVMLGEPSLRGVAMQLRAAGAGSELPGLLELFANWPTRELERALSRLRARSELATVSAVQAELGAPKRSQVRVDAELVEFRIRLVDSLEDLLTLPIFRAMDGHRAGTLPSICLTELLEPAQSGSPIAWVPEGFRIDRMPTDAGRVLVLDPVEQRMCSDLLGADAMDELSQWLTGRAQFERRQQVDEIRLPRGQALVEITVNESGVRGELGIARESPAGGRSRVRVFHLGRFIIAVEFPAEPLCVVGALEFDELQLNDAHDDLTPAARDRVRADVGRHLERLQTQLTSEFADWTGADRALGGEFLRRVLVHCPPGTGGYLARSKRGSPGFTKLVELPLFPGARRPWSAVELAEAVRRGPISTVDVRTDRALPEEPVIVLERFDLLPTLDALFGRTRDLSAEWARADEVERIKSAAPSLPRQPKQVLASIAVDGEGLSGRLWWPPEGAAGISVGRDGRMFVQRPAPGLFPCGGALAGAGLVANDDWSRMTLGRSQEQLIDSAARELWTAMIDEFERSSESPAKQTEVRRRELRDALHEQFLRLAQTGKRKGKGKRQSRSKSDAMLIRLSGLDLLRLESGHYISPDTAARERPAELAGMGLWHGPSGDELTRRSELAQRKADRELAEARRLAELEAGRQHDRAQRRAEQEQQAAEQRRRREAAARAAVPKPKPEPPRPAKRRRSEREERASAPADPSTPARRLVEAIRTELRVVRKKREGLLANHHLDSLTVAPGGGESLFSCVGLRGVQLDADHPLVRAAIADRDPTLVSLLASATYTFLNIVHDEITDENETEFLRHHAGYARSID